MPVKVSVVAVAWSAFQCSGKALKTKLSDCKVTEWTCALGRVLKKGDFASLSHGAGRIVGAPAQCESCDWQAFPQQGPSLVLVTSALGTR